jgi:hypothetical protein
MNANGVLGSMNFSSWPGLGGQFFVTNSDHEFSAAVLRACNDWHIEEWCGAYPGRFIPLAVSGFAVGPEFMAGEIRRVAAKGCHTVSFHPEPHRFSGMPDIHGEEWGPACQACADSDVVMVFHFGSQPSFMPRSPFDVLIHTMPFATGIFASELLWSPILRKFPTLRFALAEAGIGWIPYWHRFDPFRHIPHEQATVGALRALATGVDAQRVATTGTRPRPRAKEPRDDYGSRGRYIVKFVSLSQVCMPDWNCWESGSSPLPLRLNDPPLVPFWVGSGNPAIPCERMHSANFRALLSIFCCCCADT